MVSLSFVPSSCIGDEVCSWSNISIVFKQSKAQTLSSKQGNLDRGRRGQKTTTPILSSSRCDTDWRLTAVMGPSGSGKSTFLNIISERFHNSSSWLIGMLDVALYLNHISPEIIPNFSYPAMCNIETISCLEQNFRSDRSPSFIRTMLSFLCLQVTIKSYLSWLLHLDIELL